MRRLGTYTHEASIDIDIDDVIAEVTDEELLKELERRKSAAAPKPAPPVPFDVLAELAEAYHAAHAVWLPLHVCPNVLCRDAVQVLAKRPKQGE